MVDRRWRSDIRVRLVRGDLGAERRRDDEADVTAGKISWASPLAKALMGSRVGDTVVWRRPAGETQVEITDITYPKGKTDKA